MYKTEFYSRWWNFLKLITGEKKYQNLYFWNWFDGNDNLLSLKIFDAIIESSITGRKIKIYF